MAIFLVQHGKSHSKELDPEQGLSPEGMAEVERIAAVAKGYGVQVATIRHSAKQRARQTAEILAGALQPAHGVQEMSGLNPLDDVAVLARRLNPTDAIMLVGHLPFMEKLTSYLITGAADKLIFKYQNGGIVCLDRGPDSHFWFIRWALMPTIR